MSDVNEALAVLADAFSALGYPVARGGDRIPFQALALEFRVSDVTFYPARDTSLVHLLIEAAASGEEREGVRANAVGFGPSRTDALRGAADQWLDSVFPVLHYWLARHDHDLGVVAREMLVADGDTGRRFGWRVYLGPMLFMRYGEHEVAADALPNQDAIFVALFDDVAAVSAHESAFWVQAFVGRVPGHEARATCLLRNVPWPDGEAALVEWAVAQESLAGMSARQFMLWEPVAPETLESAASLSSSLDAALPKPQRRS